MVNFAKCSPEWFNGEMGDTVGVQSAHIAIANCQRNGTHSHQSSTTYNQVIDNY